jgi:hypothetical protein
MIEKSKKRLKERKRFHKRVDFELSATEPGRVKNICSSGKSVDISGGGLGLTTAFVLRKGEVLRLQLPVYEVDVTIPVFAEVMWTKSMDDQYRTGLRFLR